jgi:hypothetical protein
MAQLNWDNWRDKYRSMTFKDHVAFYSEVAKTYPNQRFGSVEPIVAFLKEKRPSKVAEVGGWKGELAVDANAAGVDVGVWVNYEISDVMPVADVPDWYVHVQLEDWLWNYEDVSKVDALLFIHSAEHMLADELVQTVQKLDPEYIVIQSPLNDDPIDWRGFGGTHILEVGWDGVASRLGSIGYSEISKFDGAQVNDRTRVYAREVVEAEADVIPERPTRKRSIR